MHKYLLTASGIISLDGESKESYIVLDKDFSILSKNKQARIKVLERLNAKSVIISRAGVEVENAPDIYVKFEDEFKLNILTEEEI